MRRLSVGVVFGGRSVEHDVSVVTAHQVMDALAARHDVVPIYVTREGRWLTGPRLRDLGVYRKRRWDDAGEEAFLPPVAGYGGLLVPGGRLRGSRRVPLDVVVPAIHGTYGEDGTLQGLLELADIPYTGSGVVGSAVGMDKVVMKAALAAADLPVIPHVVVDSDRLAHERDVVLAGVEAEIGYPAFVKPARLGSSVGIAKAHDRAGLADALDVARRYDRRLLVEPAMEGCIEVNCSVLGGAGRELHASVCEQPVAWEEFLTFSDKYLRGGKTGKGGGGMAAQERRVPAPISDELTKQVQENAIGAFRAVDAAGVARVDSFVNEATGQTWVMEINTIPGSFSFYLWEASGVSFDELVQTLLDVALAAHDRKGELMFTFDSGMLERHGGAKSGG
ncbi:MAG TPA: D-alanine--D-alanine ligase family protein [Actinomycetota bacterium]|nr:D-alanine--D-alanine ligase family protein [Actinomycetota bacterium]